MFQDLLENPRIGPLRRMCTKCRTYECFLLSFLGFVAVILGIVLITQAHVRPMTFTVGLVLIAVSMFIVILATSLAWCRAEETSERSLNRRLQGGTDWDSALQESVETASTTL